MCVPCRSRALQRVRPQLLPRAVLHACSCAVLLQVLELGLRMSQEMAGKVEQMEASIQVRCGCS